MSRGRGLRDSTWDRWCCFQVLVCDGITELCSKVKFGSQIRKRKIYIVYFFLINKIINNFKYFVCTLNFVEFSPLCLHGAANSNVLLESVCLIQFDLIVYYSSVSSHFQVRFCLKCSIKWFIPITNRSHWKIVVIIILSVQ